MLDGNVGPKKTKAIFLSSDISKAYDSIVPELMFKWLDLDAKTAEDRTAIFLLKRLYAERTVAYEGSLMAPTRGVQQGGVTSCLLFNYYLDKCLRSVPSLNDKIESGDLLAFADDIIVVTENRKDTEKAIKSMECLRAFGLVMNKDKTKLVSNHPDLKFSKDQPQSVEGVELVKAHRYLGWTLTVYKAENREHAKKFIFKTVQYAAGRWGFADPKINRQVN